MQHELTEASARLTIKHYLRTLFLISHLDSRADCTSVDATSEGEGVDPVSSGQSISRPGAEPRLLALLALVEDEPDDNPVPGVADKVPPSISNPVGKGLYKMQWSRGKKNSRRQSSTTHATSRHDTYHTISPWVHMTRQNRSAPHKLVRCPQWQHFCFHIHEGVTCLNRRPRHRRAHHRRPCKQGAHRRGIIVVARQVGLSYFHQLQILLAAVRAISRNSVPPSSSSTCVCCMMDVHRCSRFLYLLIKVRDSALEAQVLAAASRLICSPVIIAADRAEEFEMLSLVERLWNGGHILTESNPRVWLKSGLRSLLVDMASDNGITGRITRPDNIAESIKMTET